MKSTRPRGYIESYRPQAATRALLEQVRAVLHEYREALPLTCRQVFYRLVGKYEYPKDERAYARLCEHLNRARRARWIPFEAIRDDGVHGGPPLHYDGVADFLANVRHWARRAELDALAPQDVQVELYCEAAGMVPQLKRVADFYSVPVYSSGGFDSTTARKQIADRLRCTGKPAILLHLGDFDPSGVSIFDALAEDVDAYLRTDAPELPATFRRVALTAEQVARYDLPTAPPKKLDSRAAGWTDTCQLEALPPDALALLVREAIEDSLDGDLVRRLRERTDTFRRSLLDRLHDPEPEGAA
jgi:hypothetical protein